MPSSSRVSSPAPPSPARGPASAHHEPTHVVVTERDIVFDCPHCGGELVVDQEGAGMTLACTHCRKNIAVPSPVPAGRLAAPASEPPPPPTRPQPEKAPLSRVFGFEGQPPEQVAQRAEELRLQLTENRSQTTEMRGHVNRATIELHRLQLKLQKLVDRQNAIEAEMLAAKLALGRSN